MSRRAFQPFILIILSLLCGAQAASFVVERSQVRARGGGFAASFPSAIGDFGLPSYGAILSGQLTFIPENAAGCSDFYAPLPPGTDIVLVDRGSCFFVEKAFHAQQAGARAVMVADNIDEDLLTMAAPEDRPELAPLVAQLKLPVVLITRDAGNRLKNQLARSPVTVELDWSDSIAHEGSVVAWELWFTTNDACGDSCAAQRTFIKSFKDTATSLESQGYARFSPHSMIRGCPWGGADCDTDCIRGRRYCAVEPVPPEAIARGYTGADVVEMNLRALCAFQTANATAASQGTPGGGASKWWDFASRFADSCTMGGGTFTQACAGEALTAAGIDPGEAERCVGPRSTDAPHPLLEDQLREQQDVGGTGRGRVIMLPTVVINFDQYRGSLTPAGVLRALCSGFREGTEPAACLAGGLQPDDCAAGTHRCWTEPSLGLSACVDTFRGFVCRCPAGWEGDGFTCTDVDECNLGISGCDQICVNSPPGSYHCECNPGYTLHGGIGAPGMCLPDSAGTGRAGATAIPGWLSAVLFSAAVATLSVAGIVVYRWRMRQEMQGEIRAIMREYMPLPSEAVEEGRGGGSLGGSSFGRGSYKAPAGPRGYTPPETGAAAELSAMSGRGGGGSIGGGGGHPLS